MLISGLYQSGSRAIRGKATPGKNHPPCEFRHILPFRYSRAQLPSGIFKIRFVFYHMHDFYDAGSCGLRTVKHQRQDPNIFENVSCCFTFFTSISPSCIETKCFGNRLELNIIHSATIPYSDFNALMHRFGTMLFTRLYWFREKPPPCPKHQFFKILAKPLFHKLILCFSFRFPSTIPEYGHFICVHGQIIPPEVLRGVALPRSF